MKHGPVDNYEYILYQLLKRDFAGDDDVIVNVSDAFTKHYEIHGTRFLLLHGDAFPGGTGIQGPLLPWHLGEHKLRKQMASMEGWTGKPLEFDVMVFGHFHQLTFMRTMICNGSIKGFDEFAKKRNFTFEQPQQAMWFTTEDRGITLPVALFAEDSPKHGK
jgi:predicted phosphodiesterase